MNSYNHKLLEGFDQRPLLERLEHVYKHQDDLFDTDLLDKAVTHFEEELTLLEIEEFQKSDVKGTKKQRFEYLLKGLKTLSGSIEKKRERTLRLSNERDESLKKAELTLQKVNEWQKKLNLLITELLTKLSSGQKITGRKHWEVFQTLKHSQPDSVHTKKLKE